MGNKLLLLFITIYNYNYYCYFFYNILFGIDYFIIIILYSM